MPVPRQPSRQIPSPHIFQYSCPVSACVPALRKTTCWQRPIPPATMDPWSCFFPLIPTPDPASNYNKLWYAPPAPRPAHKVPWHFSRESLLSRKRYLFLSKLGKAPRALLFSSHFIESIGFIILMPGECPPANTPELNHPCGGQTDQSAEAAAPRWQSAPPHRS